jgi:hypothetical protein
MENFFNHMSSTYGRDDLDENMLEDILIFKDDFSQLADSIDKLNVILNEENTKPGGPNPAEVIRIQKEISDKQSQQADIISKIQSKYGVGSIADKEISAFTSDPDEIKRVFEYYEKIRSLDDKRARRYEEMMKRFDDKFNEALQKGSEFRSTIVNFVRAFFREVVGQIKDGGSMWMKYNAQAISDAKRLGMTHKASARAYMDTLMESSKKLSRNFAMTAEQAMKMQETFSKVTGRSAYLTMSQMEDIAASTKLMGEETVTSAIEAMDNMGTTSQTTTELLDRNYARALNSGLDVVKASDVFVKNLSLANRLNFKSGVDGISRMSILSQKIKMNLQEVANVAEKFSTIEGAVEGSAQLQMLGGAGAMYGGNPMQMLYESLSDPEALYKRVADTFAEQARFDRKRGESIIAPLQQQIIREQAKAYGINPDEAIQTAKQQAKIRDIESEIPGLVSQYGRNSEEMSLIANKAQFNKEKQAWEITYVTETGEKETVGVNTQELTPSVMKNIMKDNIEPVEDIRGRVRDIAMALIGTRERLDAIKDQWKTGKAQLLNGAMWGIDSFLTGYNKSSLGAWINGGGFGTGLGIAGLGVLSGIRTVIDWRLNKAVQHYIKTGKFSNEPIPAGAVGAGGTTGSGGGTGGGSGSGGGTRTGGGKSSVRVRYHSPKISKFGAVSKGLGVATTMVGAYELGQELGEIDEEYENKNKVLSGSTTHERANEIRKNEKEKNKKAGGAIGSWGGAGAGAIAGAKAGAAIGTAFGGPVGTAIGGVIGALAGGVGGYFAGGKLGEGVGSILGGGGGGDVTNEYLRSIDENVFSIRKGMGLALNASEVEAYDVQVNPTFAQAQIHSNVNPVYDNGYSSTSSNVSGNLALNVGGTINLNLGGSNVSQVTAQEISKMIASNQQLRNEIVSMVTKTQIRNLNGGKMEGETPRAIRSTPIS